MMTSTAQSDYAFPPVSVESFMVFPFSGVVPCESGDAPLGMMASKLGAFLLSRPHFTGVAQLAEHYLLMLAGEAVGVFLIAGGALRQRQVADLATEGHFELASCAAPLVRALAAALSDAPAVKGASSLIDVDKLLTNLEAADTSFYLTLERDGEFAVAHSELGRLAFFSSVVGGEDSIDAHTHDAIREQILLFCYEQPGVSTIVQVYTEALSIDPRVARTFREWLDPKQPAPSFYMTCSRHGKILERRLCKDHELRIGRDADNDVVIDQNSVSRHHVSIVWDGTRYKAKDQGSANGTQLNGRRFEMAPLKSGDRLILGQVEVRFDIVQPAKTAELATLWASEPMLAAPRAQLMVKGRALMLDRPVIAIGSSPTSDVRLQGWWVRPTQATIIMENGRYYLSNAGGGPRQVRIGALRVYAGGAVLQDGDEIVIAGETMQFRESAAGA